MSYKVLDGDEQYFEERVRRLNAIVKEFSSEGITVVHENCMNYGGMSYQHTLELLEHVPSMGLVYDTGNPVFNKDRSKKGDVWQDSWEFYNEVKKHIAHVHVKDCLSPSVDGKEVYTYPGEGKGYVKEIMQDLKKISYDGGISIEPHLAAVFHLKEKKDVSADDAANIYIKYGKQLMAMLESIGYHRGIYSPL
jgi:sugar phosphate isomerase/epimerase